MNRNEAEQKLKQLFGFDRFNHSIDKKRKRFRRSDFKPFSALL